MSKTKGLGPSVDFGVPMDEYDLACAVAAAKARGLKGTQGTFYRNEFDLALGVNPDDPRITACCAIGALAICKGVMAGTAQESYPRGPAGNDRGDLYPGDLQELPGLDLGRAYAHIMDLRPDDDA